MKGPLDIKRLFSPVQPGINSKNIQAQYVEYLPHLLLQPYIYCYWQVNSVIQEPGPAFTYRVIADGCIDILFNLYRPSESLTIGLSNSYQQFELGDIFHYVGIRFLPSIFPQIFKLNASELTDSYAQLDHIAPRLAEFIALEMDETMNMQQITEKFDQFFLKAIADFSFNNDARFYNALDIIFRRNGIVNIEKDLDTGISSRQLRRLFQHYLGDSAKAFSNIVRFQHVVRHNLLNEGSHEKHFLDMGFYDQAHFIKEFKAFYGLTPGKLKDD